MTLTHGPFLRGGHAAIPPAQSLRPPHWTTRASRPHHSSVALRAGTLGPTVCERAAKGPMPPPSAAQTASPRPTSGSAAVLSYDRFRRPVEVTLRLRRTHVGPMESGSRRPSAQCRNPAQETRVIAPRPAPAATSPSDATASTRRLADHHRRGRPAGRAVRRLDGLLLPVPPPRGARRGRPVRPDAERGGSPRDRLSSPSTTVPTEAPSDDGASAGASLSGLDGTWRSTCRWVVRRLLGLVRRVPGRRGAGEHRRATAAGDAGRDRPG